MAAVSAKIAWGEPLDFARLSAIRFTRELVMGHARNFLLAVGFTILSQLALPSHGWAGGICMGLTLSCENGQSYPLCPIAVTDEGEIVTGRLGIAPGRGVHMRLVPMGVGYRYIGRNVWFDGVRGDAVLFFGKHRAISCTVVHGG